MGKRTAVHSIKGPMELVVTPDGKGDLFVERQDVVEDLKRSVGRTRFVITVLYRER